MTSSSYRLSEVVQTRYEFSGFVQLGKAFDPEYRRTCRAAFLPTETENKVFRAIARAAHGNLDQGRRNLLLVSPFGTGKSLALMMVYDIFSSKGNTAAVQGFDDAVRSELLGLTGQGPYLVVPVVGTESSMPLSQAILGAFRRAVEAHPFLKNARQDGPFLLQVEYEQAALWLRQVGGGELGHLRVPLEKFLRGHSASHTLSSLEKALTDNDPIALEVWRAAFQAVTGHPPSGFGVATPRDVFDRALPELQAQGIVGIALLIDELSQYLRLYPEYEAEAIRTLDPLIHWIQEHEPCFSLVATQAVPERLEGGATDADYQAWASLRGRFHVLHMDRQRYDALVAKALERVPNPPTDPDKHPQMEELCQVHTTCFAGYGEDRATVQRTVASYYPFHPTVIAAIGAIADTLGQFERSIFQYLDRRTDDGFKDFIDRRPIYIGPGEERLELVTLDEIFRFFAKDWSKLEGVNPSLVEASRRAESAVQGNSLASRVLHLMALLGFIERRASLPTPNLQGIATMLNVPASEELACIVERFLEQGHFTYDETLGYRLVTAGGPRPIEISNAIQRAISQDVQPVTGSTVLGYLKDYGNLTAALKKKTAPPFPIQSTYEVTVKNVRKSFSREFGTARQLVEWASTLRPGDTHAGRLLVGVITMADNVDGKQYQEAVKAAKKLAQAGAIVALTRQPVDAFTKPVKTYRAAKSVSEDPRLGTSDVARQALEDAQHQLLQSLAAQYEADKLDWYTPANSTMAVRFADASAAVKAAAEKLMESFPDGIALPDLVGGSSLEKVIRPLLDGGGPIELLGKPRDVFLSALQPLGVVSVGPKTRDPKRTITLTEPDPNRSELAASAKLWDVIAKALPVGEVVGGEALHDTLQVLERPPYWSPENLVVYLLAAYMGKYGALIKRPYEGSFHSPSVEDVKALARGRSDLEVTIPQRTALSPDQRLFVESLAQAVAATLPPGAAAYVARSLDPNVPETALAKVGEDLARWYRDYGAYAKDLFVRHKLGPKEPEDFVKAVAEASAGGPDRLKAVRLYTHTLPDTLRVAGNQAPLVVEQTIQGLTELARVSSDIEDAARLRDSDSPVAAAWEKFAADCLNRELRQALLKAAKEALRDAREKAGPQPSGTSIVVQPTPRRRPTPTDDGRPGQSGEATAGPLTADELRSFAEFVLALARQVKSGQRVVASLDDLVEAYRAARGTGMRTA